jgi:hypothetical protein
MEVKIMQYENWRELTKKCMESGMSVHGWCKANNIPPTTCRQWLARLKREEQTLQNSSADHELSVWGKVELKDVGQNAGVDCHPVFLPQIKLSYCGWGIEIKEGFDLLLLSRIMKVVESVC